MENIKKFKEEQRFSCQGEPVCCMCGRYAEYICSVTDSDICSEECKISNLSSQNLSIPLTPAENYESFIQPALVTNLDFDGSKAEMEGTHITFIAFPIRVIAFLLEKAKLKNSFSLNGNTASYFISERCNITSSQR